MGSEYKLSYTATEIDEKLGAVDKKAEAVEISLADYNNLSEEEKNNGTVYFIPDAAEVGKDMIIDEAPTEGSSNLVTSGGVYDEVAKLNSDIASLYKKTLVNGWSGQLVSPKEYELEYYGRTYLVVVSSVGNGNVGASNVYLVVTSPDVSGQGLVAKLHGNIENISLTLSGNKLTLSSTTTAIWLNVAITLL